MKDYTTTPKKPETVKVAVVDTSRPWARGADGAGPLTEVTLPKAPWESSNEERTSS